MDINNIASILKADKTNPDNIIAMIEKYGIGYCPNRWKRIFGNEKYRIALSFNDISWHVNHIFSPEDYKRITNVVRAYFRSERGKEQMRKDYSFVTVSATVYFSPSAKQNIESAKKSNCISGCRTSEFFPIDTWWCDGFKKAYKVCQNFADDIREKHGDAIDRVEININFITHKECKITPDEKLEIEERICEIESKKDGFERYRRSEINRETKKTEHYVQSDKSLTADFIDSLSHVPKSELNGKTLTIAFKSTERTLIFDMEEGYPFRYSVL